MCLRVHLLGICRPPNHSLLSECDGMQSGASPDYLSWVATVSRQCAKIYVESGGESLSQIGLLEVEIFIFWWEDHIN